MSAPRTCPECGASFAPHSQRAGRQVFCTVEHKRAFWKLLEVRGRLLMPFALADRALTHSKKPADQELAKYARAQRDGLSRRWAREDKASGRNASLVVATKLADKWSHVDSETA